MSAENSRFRTLVIGKACALAVLFLSLTNQMSSLVGVGCFNSSSFLICLVFAVVFAFAIPLFKRHRALLVLSLGIVVCALVWTGLLMFLQSLDASATVPVIVLIVYTFLGRIITLMVNMQWNLHLVLNSPEEAAGYAMCSVMLGLTLFFICSAVGGMFAQLAIITLLLVSALLNLYVVYSDRVSGPYAHRIDNVVASDAENQPSKDAIMPIRMVYFASRAMYGIALGILVSLAAGTLVESMSRGVHVAVALLSFAAVIACMCGLLTEKGKLALVVATPVFAFLLAYLALSPKIGSIAWLCLFALIAEVTWSTQNAFQLPSYRRMCNLHPVTMAFGDYIAQIAPYYFCVWALSSTGFLTRYAESQGANSLMIGTVVFVTLIVVCIYAMWRHAVEYIPADHLADSEPSVTPLDQREAAASMAAGKLDMLTSREREVFELVAAGYSRTYIGKVLFISPDTVKVHTKHIYAKLGFTSKDDLIAFTKENSTIQ